VEGRGGVERRERDEESAIGGARLAVISLSLSGKESGLLSVERGREGLLWWDDFEGWEWVRRERHRCGERVWYLGTYMCICIYVYIYIYI